MANINLRIKEYLAKQANALSIEEAYTLMRAIEYKTTGYGNCSHRSSYAAMRLRLCLTSDTKIKISNSPSRDQYAIVLGSKEQGYFVYDPLTNPTLLFEQQYYQQTILSQYPLVTQNSGFKKYNLIVSEALAELFNKQLPQYRQVVRQAIQRGTETTEQYSADNNMRPLDYLARIMTNSGLFSQKALRHLNETPQKKSLILSAQNWLTLNSQQFWQNSSLISMQLKSKEGVIAPPSREF